VPDQPPFQPNREEGDGARENMTTTQAPFEDLSYVDMRTTCRTVAQWMENDNTDTLLKVSALFQQLGWFETPNNECLDRLDAAVDVGWTGRKVDKDEVPPFDMLYREIRSRFGHRMWGAW
jgi:hypothetical protein